MPTWHLTANLCNCRLLARGKCAENGALALIWAAEFEYDSKFRCLPDVLIVLIAFMVHL